MYTHPYKPQFNLPVNGDSINDLVRKWGDTFSCVYTGKEFLFGFISSLDELIVNFWKKDSGKYLSTKARPTYFYFPSCLFPHGSYIYFLQRKNESVFKVGISSLNYNLFYYDKREKEFLYDSVEGNPALFSYASFITSGMEHENICGNFCYIDGKLFYKNNEILPRLFHLVPKFILNKWGLKCP
jgi:hypothetical protein